MAGNKAAFDAAMKRAQDYAFEDAWEKALREYQRALDEFPDDATARTNYAQALFRLQQWPAALLAYQSLLTLRPSDPFVLSRIAESQVNLRQRADAERTYLQVAAVHAAQNQVREALSALRNVLSLNPRNRQARERLADYYRSMGERNLAIQEYLTLAQQAVESVPENLDLAVAQAETAFSLDSNNPAARDLLYKLRRRQAEVAGVQFDEKTLRVVNQQQPDARDLEQMFQLAVQYQEKGQFAAARVQFEAAQSAGLDTPGLHYNMGLLSQQDKDWPKAIDHLRRAVSDPDYAMSSYYVLGECYRESGQVLEANRAFERAVGLVDLQHVTKNELPDLIDLYRAAADANLAASNVPRAASLYANLASFLQSKRWRTGFTDQLAERAKALSDQGITGRLQSIGGPAPPEPPPLVVSPPTTPLSGASLPQAAMSGNMGTANSAMLRPITDFLREQQDAGIGSGAAEAVSALEMLARVQPAVAVPGAPVSRPGTAPLTGARALLATSDPPPDPDAAALVDAVDELISQQLWMAASDCCFEVIHLAPEYLPIHLRLAEIYKGQSRTEDAVAKLQSIIDVYLVRGEPSAAAQVFPELIALQPENINLRTKLATLFLDLGQPEAAVREYLILAEMYYGSGQHERALEELRRARTLAPQNAEVRVRTGLYLLRSDQPADAVPEFSRALQLDGENGAALVGIFVCMVLLGNDTEWDVLETLLVVATPLDRRQELADQLRSFALTTDRPELFYALALVNDLDVPKDVLDEAARGDLERRQLHAQIDALDDGLRQLPVDDTSALGLLMRFRRAHLALVLNDASRAIGLLTTAQAALDANQPPASPRPKLDFMKLPTRLDIYQPLAQSYAMAGDNANAIVSLLAAKAYAPYDRGIYTQLAELYFRQGQLGAALAALDELINHYQEQGQIDKVLETLGYMARLAPNNIQVRQKLADTYLKIGYIDQGLTELEALGDLQHKAGMMKDAVRTYQRGADIYWQMGHLQDAFTIYDRVVRMAPGDVDARQQLIHLYITSGRIADAIREQKRIAEIYLQQKRSKDAIAALHELIALAPEDVDSYYALAELLAEQHEYSQAARLYGRLRRLEPAKDAQLAELQADMQRQAEEKLSAKGTPGRPQPAGGR